MAKSNETTAEILEQRIEKAQAEARAAKVKYDAATAKLKQLLDKRDALRRDTLMKALAKSDRSFEEVMAFIRGDKDEDN